MPIGNRGPLRADRHFVGQTDGQLLFLISPDRDRQRKRNARQRCLHQRVEEVGVECQIDQRARQD
jgi:hypothetical protein